MITICSRVGSSIQLTGCHDVISTLCQSHYTIENGIGATGDCQPCHFVGTFQLGITNLQDMIGGIVDARVNVAELLQSKEILGVCRVLKHKRSSAVERNSTRSAVPNANGGVLVRGVATMPFKKRRGEEMT